MNDDSDEGTWGALIQTALDWGYDRAIDGFPPLFLGAEALALEYKSKYAEPDLAIDALITWAAAEAAAAGFVTGVGGWATLPVSLPANLASVLAVQLRLSIAIACLRGHGARDHTTKTFALATLLGGGAVAALEQAGVRVGAKLAANLIALVPRAALSEVNRFVGVRLVTKAGTTGVVNLSKLVPIAGGLVGGGIDAAATFAVGQTAKLVFPRDVADPAPPDSATEISISPQRQAIAQT